jgi:hypothetical protein
MPFSGQINGDGSLGTTSNLPGRGTYPTGIAKSFLWSILGPLKSLKLSAKGKGAAAAASTRPMPNPSNRDLRKNL